MKRILYATAALCLVAVLLAACCSRCRYRRMHAKPLIATEWHLMQLDGLDMDAEESTFNITFAADGSVTGIGSCNRLMGRYEVTPTRSLHIGSMASTRAFCPRQQDEDKFLRTLQATTHYDIDYDMLILLQDGVQTAVLRAK